MNAQVAHQDASAPTIQKLRNTVEGIDALSQNGFSKISAIARLALLALEKPDGYLREGIAHAIEAIEDIAVNIEDCISNAAEEVGCNYRNEPQLRRNAAMYATREA